MALFAFKEAAIATGIAAQEFPSLKGGNTKQDAYRHILWNALLCHNYRTVSSKSPKLSFAKAVTDAYEECGDNDEDARQMDYHNNGIGRKLYTENTPYRTFLGFITGLKSPSLALLKRKTREVVDDAFFIDNRIGIIVERATKIRTKKFNCTTKYSRRSRNICEGFGDNILEEPLIIGDFEQIEYSEDCWETYYVPYQSCDASKAVYISKELK